MEAPIQLENAHQVWYKYLDTITQIVGSKLPPEVMETAIRDIWLVYEHEILASKTQVTENPDIKYGKH